MEQHRLWDLLAKKLSGEASRKELQELQEFLDNNPAIHPTVKVFTDLWNQSPSSAKASASAEQAYGSLAQKLLNEDEDFAREHGIKPKPKNIVEETTPAKGNFFRDSVLANHLKIAWRNLSRKKAFSITNISGLSLGMASAGLLLLWIFNQLSYDQFHKKKDRIYHVYMTGMHNEHVYMRSVTPMILAPVLKSDYPEVEDFSRTNWVGAFTLKNGDTQVHPQGFLVDPGFLKMFDYPLLEGNAQTALDSMFSIILTRPLAKELFGETEGIVGRKIRVDSNQFTVTGLLKDLPPNTRYNRFQYLVPWSYHKHLSWDKTDWHENSIVSTYVLLKKGVSGDIATQRMRNVFRSHTKDMDNGIYLHPMPKWQLWSGFDNGKIVGGNIEEVRLYAIIAAFILIIACINYMNLSTARNVTRAREVGIRKIAGAGRRLLVGQFLIESLLISFLSGLIALGVMQLSIGWFNKITWSSLFIPYANPWFWIMATGFLLFTGLIAGIYPAFYLSSFRPLIVLKKNFKILHGLLTPRRVLVVVQFTLAIMFIVCTIVVYRQLEYGKERDRGYSSDNLAYVYYTGDIKKNYHHIRNELLKTGVATSVTQSNSPITELWNWTDQIRWKGKDTSSPRFIVRVHIDDDFVKTMQLRLVAGREVDVRKYPSDSTAILLNESAVKFMGFKNPLGEVIRDEHRDLHVVGVVKDFLTNEPYDIIYPMVLDRPGPNEWYGTITFRMNNKYSKEDNLKGVTDIFKKYNPEYPFEYYMVDRSFAIKFQGTQYDGQLAAIFAGLSILISCLGLFALAAFTAENRIKEIGIRKVLGASVTTIVTLLSKEFFKLVTIAFVIATPVSWWLMNSWLHRFPYRAELNWWIFAVTGLLIIFITLATISYQAIKAAMSNPARSLRTE